MPVVVDRSKPDSRCLAPPRIRGRRWLLFAVDLERDSALPLCMGRSRDWLAFRAHKVERPRVVEIDASEANSIARRGVLEIDNTTVAEIARAVGCSRRLVVDVLRALTAEERAARQSGTFGLGVRGG